MTMASGCYPTRAVIPNRVQNSRSGPALSIDGGHRAPDDFVSDFFEFPLYLRKIAHLGKARCELV